MDIVEVFEMEALGRSECVKLVMGMGVGDDLVRIRGVDWLREKREGASQLLPLVEREGVINRSSFFHKCLLHYYYF